MQHSRKRTLYDRRRVHCCLLAKKAGVRRLLNWGALLGPKEMGSLMNPKARMYVCLLNNKQRN
nr:hypothetical protein Q903MT_gene5998 [Picea sitchensis]